MLRCHVAAFEALGGVPERDPLRPHEDRRARRGRRPRHRLQRQAARPGRALRLPAARPAGPTGPRPRARSSGRSATSARTSSSAARFRNLDDLNAQFSQWLDQVANGRLHATTRRVVAEHFAEERRLSSRCRPGRSTPCCGSSAASPTTAWSRSAAISTACPTAPAAASVEVQITASEVRILEDGAPDRRPSRAGGPRPAPHRRGPPHPAAAGQQRHAPASAAPAPAPRAATVVAPRSLAIYEADRPPSRRPVEPAR